MSWIPFGLLISRNIYVHISKYHKKMKVNNWFDLIVEL